MALSFQHAFILLVTLFSPYYLISQSDRHSIDSLKTVLRVTESDTTKAWTFYRLSNEYFNISLDTAGIYDFKAHELAKKGELNSSGDMRRNFRELLVLNSESLGDLKTNQGKHKEAQEFFQLSVDYQKKIGDVSGAALGLSQVAYSYMRRGDIDKAKEYFKKAISLHPKNKDRDILGEIYNNAGFMYMGIGADTIAEKYYNKAIEIREEKNENTEALTLTYNNLGLLFYNRSDYSEAIRLWYKSLTIAQKDNHKERMAQCYNNLAAVYSKQENTEKAFEHFKKALWIYKEIDDKYGVPTAYSNLANQYEGQGDYIIAKKYYSKALEGFRNIDFRREVSSTLVNIAGMYIKLDQLDLAYSYSQEAYEISSEIEYKRIISAALRSKGKIEFLRENYYEATLLSKEALEIGEEISNLKRIESASFTLYKSYERLNNWEQAFRYYDQYITARDSNSNMRIERELNRSQAQHKIEAVKRDAKFKEKVDKQRIRRLKKDKLIRTRTIYFITSAGFLSLLSGLLWFRGYRRKINLKEQEAEQELKELLRRVNLLQTNLNSSLISSSEVNPELINEKLKGLLNTSLTKREMEVLIELCTGKNNKEISNSLFVSVNTVRTHLYKVYEKLDVKSRTQAVKIAQNLSRK